VAKRRDKKASSCFFSVLVVVTKNYLRVKGTKQVRDERVNPFDARIHDVFKETTSPINFVFTFH